MYARQKRAPGKRKGKMGSMWENPAEAREPYITKYAVLRDKTAKEIISFAEKHEGVFVFTFITRQKKDCMELDYTSLDSLPLEKRVCIINPYYNRLRCQKRPWEGYKPLPENKPWRLVKIQRDWYKRGKGSEGKERGFQIVCLGYEDGVDFPIDCFYCP